MLLLAALHLCEPRLTPIMPLTRVGRCDDLACGQPWEAIPISQGRYRRSGIEIAPQNSKRHRGGCFGRRVKPARRCWGDAKNSIDGSQPALAREGRTARQKVGFNRTTIAHHHSPTRGCDSRDVARQRARGNPRANTSASLWNGHWLSIGTRRATNIRGGAIVTTVA